MGVNCRSTNEPAAPLKPDPHWSLEPLDLNYGVMGEDGYLTELDTPTQQNGELR
jgi:hypothetical protein